MRWLVPCAAAAAVLAGCGSADDGKDVRVVVERFSGAVAADDGATACRQLSDALAEAIERDSGEDCSDAIVEGDGRNERVAAPTVFVTSASARVGSSTVFLDREPSGWKITALGCRAEGVSASDEPLGCEAEA